MKKTCLFTAILLLLTITPSISPADSMQAKNIILMIGDGMGPNHMAVYNYYAQRVLKREPVFTQVANQGEIGWMLHHPAPGSGIVTDSAAGATAFSTGIKTLNGRIAVDPEGNYHPTFLEIAKKHGKKTAIVSNIPPFDATESAFTSHTESRKDYDTILHWTFALNKPDILLGSAHDERQDEINELAQKNGYTILTQGEELKTVSADRLTYGVFDVVTPYRQLPAPAQRSTVTLSELTGATLHALHESENGFFIMIEGAKIDKVSHPNDAGSVLREMEEFDNSIAVAFDYARKNPNTLLIITADHETGGLSITGGTEKNLSLLGKQKEPLQDIRDRLGEEPSIAEIRETFTEGTGIEISQADAIQLHENWNKPEAVWGEILEKYTKVGFLSLGHTATPVALIGYGPGSQRCNGWRDNTDVFHIMMDAAGLTY